MKANPREYHIRSGIISLLIFGIICLGTIVFAEQFTGAKDIVLLGGDLGDVSFPHLKHQQTLGDCNICHNYFSQEAGVIQKLIAEGKLKKKQMMNTLCMDCHKQREAAGEKAGPLSCKACHIK